MVEEFGDALVFPYDEFLVSTWMFTEDMVCFDGNDDPLIANILVTITNLTDKTVPLWYVADYDTSITNVHGFIGNASGGVAGHSHPGNLCLGEGL